MERLFACLSLIALFSCSTVKKNAHVVLRDSVYIEKFVPIKIKSDSAMVKALLHCNRNNAVSLSKINTLTTKNARLEFELDSLGNLLVRSTFNVDSVYVKEVLKEIKSKEVVTEYVERNFTKWETFILRYGHWSLGALSIFFVYLIFLVVKFLLSKIKR